VAGGSSANSLLPVRDCRYAKVFHSLRSAWLARATLVSVYSERQHRAVWQNRLAESEHWLIMFFVPSNISSLRISDIPVSPSLRTALRCLGIHFWGELHGLPKQEIRGQGYRGESLLKELETLLGSTRSSSSDVLKKAPGITSARPRRPRDAQTLRLNPQIGLSKGTLVGAETETTSGIGGNPSPSEAVPTSSQAVVAADHRGKNRFDWSLAPDDFGALEGIPVEAIAWSARAMHAIQQKQCKVLSDIVACPKSEWENCQNVGKKTLNELDECLRAFIASKPPLFTSTTRQTDGVALSSTIPDAPLERMKLFWRHLQRDLANTPHVDRAFSELSLSLGIPLATTKLLRVRDVLCQRSFQSFLRATSGIGIKRGVGLAEILWRLWAEVVPDGPAGPPPAPPGQAAASIVAGLGDMPSTMAIIEKAMITAGLTAKERNVLIMRHGLSGQRALTLEEVGAIKALTRERIRQIERKAVDKLITHSISRELLSIAIDRRIEAVLEALQRESGGKLIRKDAVSWSCLDPRDAFLIVTRYDSLEVFLDRLTLANRLVPIGAGWWPEPNLMPY